MKCMQRRSTLCRPANFYNHAYVSQNILLVHAINHRNRANINKTKNRAFEAT